MSQMELGRRAGISRQALAAIELGTYQPGVATALSLARELGQTVESLFGEGDMPKHNQIEAVWRGGEHRSKNVSPCRVALGRVGGRVVAVPQPITVLSLSPAAGTAERIEGKLAAVLLADVESTSKNRANGYYGSTLSAVATPMKRRTVT
jgi:DNA-binding XRE family transcriptional regulator